VVRLVVTGGSLTRWPKRSLRYLLVEVTWQIKGVPKPNLLYSVTNGSSLLQHLC